MFNLFTFNNTGILCLFIKILIVWYNNGQFVVFPCLEIRFIVVSREIGFVLQSHGISLHKINLPGYTSYWLLLYNAVGQVWSSMYTLCHIRYTDTWFNLHYRMAIVCTWASLQQAKDGPLSVLGIYSTGHEWP